MNQFRMASALLFAFLPMLLTGCAARAGTLPVAHVTIKGHEFALEVARTEDQRETGLMYRDTLAADHGMIFIFDRPDTYAFWMHNTRIPLDIIFLAADGKVVDIQTRTAYDETSRPPKAPALTVIELPAGTAHNLKLAIGDTITLPAKELKPSTRPSDNTN